MKILMRRLPAEDQAQDITEYSLLLAFVVLAAAGIFVVNAGSLATIWVATNGIVNLAATKAQASVS
jgi:hypothetical protein